MSFRSISSRIPPPCSKLWHSSTFMRSCPLAEHKGMSAKCTKSRHLPIHSITSSASAMSDGGTSRARALAVLKLMTSSVRGGLYSQPVRQPSPQNSSGPSIATTASLPCSETTVNSPCLFGCRTPHPQNCSARRPFRPCDIWRCSGRHSRWREILWVKRDFFLLVCHHRCALRSPAPHSKPISHLSQPHLG